MRAALVKAVWFSWRVLVPLLVWRVPLGTYAGLFLLSELVSGYWLAWNFQVRNGAPGDVRERPKLHFLWLWRATV
jgi:hypothetical protein